MESISQKELFNSILAKIIQLQSNSTNTSRDEIILLIDKYKSILNETDNSIEILRDEYMNTYELPRKEKELAYKMYVDEKKNLYDEWKKTNTNASLEKFIQFKLPEQLENLKNENKDFSIFTMYPTIYHL